MGDIEKCCFYCLRRDIEVIELPDWTKNGRIRYYCHEHYAEVKKFQDKQKQDFLHYYSRLPEVEKEKVLEMIKMFKEMDK